MATGENSRNIAVDAMGGDRGPAEVVKALELALQDPSSPHTFTLVGKEDVLAPLLNEHGLSNNSRVRLFPASQVIGMEEKPIRSLKEKKDASLVRAIELVRDGECQAAVSCGNTGALMACGTLRLRPMEGVERPALGSIWPSRQNYFAVLDVGANPTPKPEHMVHQAILGKWYCQTVLNRPNPRIGLLSIGTEESKGHDFIRQTHEHLKNLGHLINYSGLIEGFTIFEDKVDVVLCDGFTGNVLLKSCESLFRMLKDVIKEELTRNPVRMVGALLVKGGLNGVKERLNPDRYNGAPLLGLRGNVIKTHGSSNKFAIASALRIASEFVRHDLSRHALEDVLAANQILRRTSAVG
jgi:phosphate acyltransferase